MVAQRRAVIRLELLQGFGLFEHEEPIAVSAGSEKLLALLALRSRPARRRLVAGVLWPQVGDERALANLRSALSRLDCVSRRAVNVDDADLSIAEHVAVDIREARLLARRLLDTEATLQSSSYAPAVVTLSGDLLSGWYDQWILDEVAEWEQPRLYALEALARVLTSARRFHEAAMVARAAVRMDPLRETAYAALIRNHLAEGNQVDALKALKRYEYLLFEELGLSPTCQLYQLLPKGSRAPGPLEEDGACRRP